MRGHNYNFFPWHLDMVQVHESLHWTVNTVLRATLRNANFWPWGSKLTDEQHSKTLEPWILA